MPVLNLFGSKLKFFSVWGRLNGNRASKAYGWLASGNVYAPTLDRLVKYRGSELTLCMSQPEDLAVEVGLGETITHKIIYIADSLGFHPQDVILSSEQATNYQLWLILADLTQALNWLMPNE